MLNYVNCLENKTTTPNGGKDAVAGLKTDRWFNFENGGISQDRFGSIAMIVNIIFSLEDSRMTLAPPQEVQDIDEDIRIPAGIGEAKMN